MNAVSTTKTTRLTDKDEAVTHTMVIERATELLRKLDGSAYRATRTDVEVNIIDPAHLGEKPAVDLMVAVERLEAKVRDSGRLAIVKVTVEIDGEAKPDPSKRFIDSFKASMSASSNKG